MVVGGRAQLIPPHAEYDVLHDVDRALAPVDVHLAALLAPFRSRIPSLLTAFTSASRTGITYRANLPSGRLCRLEPCESDCQEKPFPIGQILVPASADSLQTDQLNRRSEWKRAGSMWRVVGNSVEARYCRATIGRCSCSTSSRYDPDRMSVSMSTSFGRHPSW